MWTVKSLPKHWKNILENKLLMLEKFKKEKSTSETRTLVSLNLIIDNDMPDIK